MSSPLPHAAEPVTRGGARALVFDRLGLLLVLPGTAACVLPLLIVKPNRIMAGVGKTMVEALPGPAALGLALGLIVVACVALLARRPGLRLAAALFGIAVLAVTVGQGATHWSPPDDRFVRVAPGAAAWLLLLLMGLMATDALARLRVAPLARLLALAAFALAAGVALWAGLFDDLSILREYQARADVFAREAQQHVVLAFGSSAAAALAGVPLGIACQRQPRVRAATLPVLTIIQTIPSIALFGLLMTPLALVAQHVPGAAELGIRGIGAAPALLALFLYALLPITANTALGLDQVAPAAVDAARGMGLTPRQRLREVELPLAMPAIVAGLRIVLVQNIGLATVAALIGGGGFGAFVFQGVGQTAMDLVLLGAIPTVALAFAAAVALDAAVEGLSSRRLGAEAT